MDAGGLDRERFAELVRPLERPLRSYLYRLCASPDVVDDLYQTALLRAFEQRHAFRGEASFKTWLFRIASHAAIDHLRRSRRWEPDAQDRARAAAIADPDFGPAVQALGATGPETRYEVHEHVAYCSLRRQDLPARAAGRRSLLRRSTTSATRRARACSARRSPPSITWCNGPRDPT